MPLTVEFVLLQGQRFDSQMRAGILMEQTNTSQFFLSNFLHWTNISPNPNSNPNPYTNPIFQTELKN